MTRQEDKDMRDMMEEESPKKIIVSFVLSMVFGVAAALAAVAFREVLQHLTNYVLTLPSVLKSLNASQPQGIKNLSSISGLVIMLLGWVIAFLTVWHKIEKAPTMKKRVRFGLAAIIVALALFGLFEVCGYAINGSWLMLNGAIF